MSKLVGISKERSAFFGIFWVQSLQSSLVFIRPKLHASLKRMDVALSDNSGSAMLKPRTGPLDPVETFRLRGCRNGSLWKAMENSGKLT